jgi:hypothetical protein
MQSPKKHFLLFKKLEQLDENCEAEDICLLRNRIIPHMRIMHFWMKVE